ncbi:MAG: acetyl-CoA carboxylase biotin carboxyl carrier protein subunit [Terriglobia bacterium]|nr:MAG: acetyl-CoA carboxylase biotin carboxyl carrier protein subunit [Terriglobia bacterium]
MKLQLTINGAEEEIEILAPHPNCRFRWNGTEQEASVELPEPGVYSILHEGRSYDAGVERTARGLVVLIDGNRFEITVRDPRRWSRHAAGHAGSGLETLSALMPGKVVRVLISVGDTVAAGQGVLVVEAMKMQNEMKAPRAGRVVAVHAREGMTVAAGEVLATIE